MLSSLAHTILMLITTPESVKAVPGWNCRPPGLGRLAPSAGIESLGLLTSICDLHSPANTAKQGRHEVGGLVLYWRHATCAAYNEDGGVLQALADWGIEAGFQIDGSVGSIVDGGTRKY